MTLEEWVATVEPTLPPTTPKQRARVRRRRLAFAWLERATKQAAEQTRREREYDEAHCMGCME